MLTLSGVRWFTVRAARRVGSSGRVHAINRDYSNTSQLAPREASNVRTVLGRRRSVPPQQSVDAVLILKTYHEIAQPVRLLKHLRQSMRAARAALTATGLVTIMDSTAIIRLAKPDVLALNSSRHMTSQAGWHGLLFWFFRRMVDEVGDLPTRTGCYGAAIAV